MTIKLLASAFKLLKPDYVLVDSWFTCYRLVASVAKKAHFLGMIKMGKTKYLYNGKSLTCNDILAKKELEYQTIGGIFKDIQKDTQTPTLDERILLIIKELVLDLAEILEIPFEELITKIISENKQLMKWINLNPLSEAA